MEENNANNIIEALNNIITALSGTNNDKIATNIIDALNQIAEAIAKTNQPNPS